MLDIRKQAALSDTVAPQLVSHDHPRHVLQACKQSSEEALGGIGVSPFLNKDIEHNAVLIDGTPKIVLHALDLMNTSSMCHLSPGRGRRRRRRLAKVWPNFLHH